MKSKKYLCHPALVALFIGLAGQAWGFPIYLSALKGNISATPHYGSTTATTTNRATTMTVSLKNMLLVVSNQVFLDTSVHPPGDARVAFELHNFNLFLTNSSGYYYSLSQNFDGRVRISDVATTFTTNSVGGITSEKDTLNLYLDLEGFGSDGLYYQFKIGGAGSLVTAVNQTTGVNTTTIALSPGGGPGVLQSSDDGVSSGSFTFKGSGIPEWSGAYSVYWWNY